MLSSLLPGLREVRVPLVAGCVYFICAWILVKRSTLDHLAATHFVIRIEELTTWVGPSIALAGLAISLYIIGSLLQFSRLPLQRLDRRWKPFVDGLENRRPKRVFTPMHNRLKYRNSFESRLSTWINLQVRPKLEGGVNLEHINKTSGMPLEFRFSAGERLGHAFISDEEQEFLSSLDEEEKAAEQDRVADGILQDELQQFVRDEFDTLVIRLQIERPELYSDYDRVRAEAEFRLALVVPLMGFRPS